MSEISSWIEKFEKPNLTTETRRRGENQIQLMVSSSGLTSFNTPLRSFVSFVVNGFPVLIFGNSSSIGVSA